MTRPADYPEQPAHLFDHFHAISQIPRPSAQEAAVRDYVTGLAEERGLSWRSDARGNVVIKVPGSPGRESEPVVIVQNHLDMVTVKTDDKTHDFATDPLTLQVEDGWLLADRTTLGADNGIGCAAALALMTDQSVSRPPLELLFTVEEETGLYGASDLDPGLLSGNRMLNLDTEDWGELFIGCAGGRGWVLRRSMARQAVPADTEAWRLKLGGLAGGHSGIQIHQQLGNAIKLLGQWLMEARDIGVHVAGLHGGVAHNVIPREATLEFYAPAGASERLEALSASMLARWRSFLPEADAGLTLELSAADILSPLTGEAQAQLQQLLLVFPHGAVSYNPEQPADLVDLSINFAVLRVDEEGLFLETTLRYFNDNEARGLAQQVLAIGEWLDCSIESTIDYPGWKPEFDNPLLELASSCYRDLFGEEPAVKAIHAGLECGILKSKKADLDVVSFGPTIRGAHSPRERLEIQTVEPFWRLLTTLLERL